MSHDDNVFQLQQLFYFSVFLQKSLYLKDCRNSRNSVQRISAVCYSNSKYIAIVNSIWEITLLENRYWQDTTETTTRKHLLISPTSEDANDRLLQLGLQTATENTLKPTAQEEKACLKETWFHKGGCSTEARSTGKGKSSNKLHCHAFQEIPTRSSPGSL